jgi:hypothetical protein
VKPCFLAWLFYFHKIKQAFDFMVNIALPLPTFFKETPNLPLPALIEPQIWVV